MSRSPLVGSWVALHLPSCHQDTSWPFISLCFLSLFFFLVWFLLLFLATEGKQEAPAAESNSSRALQGKAGDRSSVLYSAGQFFFEYLVVVSLKKTSDGRYEPKITYQFPKVFSPTFGEKNELQQQNHLLGRWHVETPPLKSIRCLHCALISMG